MLSVKQGRTKHHFIASLVWLGRDWTMDWRVLLPLFYKDGFAIKYPMKVDMSLKQNKSM